jgi:hypothetical protein
VNFSTGLPSCLSFETRDTMKRLHMGMYDTVKPDFSGKRVKWRALVS